KGEVCPAPANEVNAAGEAWLCIVQLFKSDENKRRYLGAADALSLTPAALHALVCIAPGEAKPMRVLADEWHCDRSNVTSIIDQLEERGLVERRVLRTDRRVKTICLTDAGARSRRQATELLSVPPASFGVLSEAEQRRLRNLLRKVTTDLPPLR
ncbi:MAG: MarR family winged helix-turn-helix transcriptional regulator, partial [Actinomycetota bacterium]